MLSWSATSGVGLLTSCETDGLLLTFSGCIFEYMSKISVYDLFIFSGWFHKFWISVKFLPVNWYFIPPIVRLRVPEYVFKTPALAIPKKYALSASSVNVSKSRSLPKITVSNTDPCNNCWINSSLPSLRAFLTKDNVLSFKVCLAVKEITSSDRPSKPPKYFSVTISDAAFKIA